MNTATLVDPGVLEASEPRFRRLPPAPAALVRMLVSPLVTAVSLLACLAWFHVPLSGAYWALLLLAVLMTTTGDVRSWAATAGRPSLQVIGRWFVVAALLVLFGWASGTLEWFDRPAIVAWLVVTPLGLAVAHRASTALLARVLSAAGMQRTAVIVGANDIGRRLAEKIGSNPCLGIRVVGFFDDRDSDRLGDVDRPRILGPMDRLADFVKRRRVDVIYSALPMCPQPRIRQLLDELRDTTASVYFVPDVLLFDLIQARMATIGGIPVLAVRETPCYGLTALTKRCFDLVVASGILVLITPLLAAIALAVRLTSPGPVLFRQRRYGLDGREILVYKFRTMTCLEDGDVVRQATAGDARMTPIGEFLRRYSLDELPQFVNVIQGRMSVVGPRPHAVAHNEQYRRLIPGYMIRHKVKPGITGLAQVNGLRGETDTLEKMQARIDCDLAYLRNWSTVLDLQIILRTIGVVLRRTNAY